MNKIATRLCVIFFCMFLSLQVMAKDEEQNGAKGGISYLAGFVTEKDKQGLRDAIIIVTHRHIKLFSLRSTQNGWYETVSPIDSRYIGQKLLLTVLKRGYEPEKMEFTLQPYTNFHHVKMELNPNYQKETEYDRDFLDVMYGYVSDSEKNIPIKGAIITISTKSDGLPVSSGVSRENGYFNIFYNHSDVQMDLEYSVKHLQYDTGWDKFSFTKENALFGVRLNQNKYSFSVGMSVHFQATTRLSDEETGGVFSINTSYYPDKLLVIDKYFPRFHKTGVIGYDLSVGLLPYLEGKVGPDEATSIYVLSAGVSIAIKNFLFPIRAGVSVNDTEKVTPYIGVNVPFKYF